MKRNEYNPDILNCLANLSSDEVFTSPDLANKMIDLLPQNLFEDPNTTFLDPCCKSGVFLREIAKRLINGLKNIYPDLNERINHIMSKQIYGIALTQLTSQMSRRTVYCARRADSKYSIATNFSNINGKDSYQGNIKYSNCKHIVENNKCIFCGASKDDCEKLNKHESHAYLFIHTKKPKEIFNMKFDVIIGNPPYQLDDGGAQASARPIYQLFIQNSIKLQPRYLCMIVPARWYAGGKGLDEFRKQMLNDTHLKELYDFSNSADCFPTLGDRNIKGGVCYFLWDKFNKGPCTIHNMENENCLSVSTRYLKEKDCDIFIRDVNGVSILNKIRKLNKGSFSSLVSARKPFGMATNYSDYTKTETSIHQYKLFANKSIGYVDKYKVNKNLDWISKYKVLVPEAVGEGDPATDHIKPILSEPNSCCTETYLVIGPFEDKNQANNCISYINTKFFHFLLSLKKITQHTTQKCYEFIPMQDFSKPWDDNKLYKKYDLSKAEIEYIENTIWPDKE